MRYRRSQTTGGTFFFTVVTYQRQPLFKNANNINLLRAAIRETKVLHPFKIDAFVVLPDHLHCIWTLPLNDKNFSTRWRLIKSYFTRACLPQDKCLPTRARQHKGEQSIWQRRFWEHQIRDEQDFIKHVEYIHYNPVKHGYVNAVRDWPYSSFHHHVRAGICTLDWGGEKPNFGAKIGRE